MAEQRVTIRQKRAVMERANNCCEYCHAPEPYASDTFAIEHIVPRALGGTTSLDNLALSCQGCNGHKYAKMEGLDPLINSVCPLFHPRQHVWREHFTWNEDFTEIIGYTPIGRTTVATLQMNREKLINFRRVLHAAGKHLDE